MKSTNFYFAGILSLALAFSSCTQDEDIHDESTQSFETPSTTVTNARSLGITGSSADVTTTTTGGTVLMGGGPDVDRAMQWMIDKSGGGDFVVIRATGTNAYNDYIYGLGTVNSVETLLIDSRSLANDAAIADKIRKAEALFIAGGDQYDYVSYWKGTKVEDAINYLRNVKQVPIGGTSAGCAIMGATYFDAANGTVRSSEALRNPYRTEVSLQRDNFIDNPFLDNTITDTHYNDPDRRGRHVTFLARMNQDWGINGKGIGVDEETAVCIDNSGKAVVFGNGYAFFLQQNGAGPERCAPRKSLDWYRNRRAVEVYKVLGNNSGANYFWLDRWNGGSGGSWQYYYADRGRLQISY
ncbi:cyanophycinase [Flavobacteriaceae bacterium M23B6Z8]